MTRSPDDWVMHYSVLGSKEMVLSLETLTSNQARALAVLGLMGITSIVDDNKVRIF